MVFLLFEAMLSQPKGARDKEELLIRGYGGTFDTNESGKGQGKTRIERSVGNVKILGGLPRDSGQQKMRRPLEGSG